MTVSINAPAPIVKTIERGINEQVFEIAWRIHTASFRWLGRGRLAALGRHLSLRMVAFLGGGRAIEVPLDTGQKLVVDPCEIIECHIGRFGEWEGAIHKAVQTLVGDGATVLDVGAHVGYSTVLFADWVGPRGRVWCFEPFAPHHPRIRANLRVNGFEDRVRIVPAAVSSRNGTALFGAPGTLNKGVGSLAGAARMRSTSQTATIALDDWMSEGGIADVSLCKIDVEGAEGEVLRGMELALRNHAIDALLLEFHPSRMGAFGDSIESIASTLNEFGYSVRFWDDVKAFSRTHQGEDDLNALALSRNRTDYWD